MKKIATLVLAVTTLLVIITSVYAAHTNLPHRYTWDADMINSDLVHPSYTGEGVYVAVLDTGLVPNWRDFFPSKSIATQLGIGFYQNVKVENTLACDNITKTGPLHKGSFIGSTGSSHGTHVASTIIGYNYYAPADAAAGLPLPPLFIEGIAPDATIIPVKVLDTYHFPCAPGAVGGITFGTDEMVAAGITYATDLKLEGYAPMVISMSLGGPEPTTIIEDAIDYAIENGVIVVAAAGNAANVGMDWPGAYPQVISAGASGWRYEWYQPGPVAPPPRYRLWWLQDATYGFNNIPEPTPVGDVYITDFTGQENQTLAGLFSNCGSDNDQVCVQELDVVAPGSWVRGPFEASQGGYAHLPWWSPGIAWLTSHAGLTNFFYLGGTSMATPHVSAVAAMMLEKNPTLTQSDVESILTTWALPIPPGSMTIYDLVPAPGFYVRAWGTNATGSGLVLADQAVANS